MQDEEVKIESINKRLTQINEEKINHEYALSRHDQLEEEIYMVDVQGRKIFQRLFDSWAKDRGFIKELDLIHENYEQNRRQIQADMENKMEKLLCKKKELYDTEDQLTDLKYTLAQEDH
jgi:hypothetical protein